MKNTNRNLKNLITIRREAIEYIEQILNPLYIYEKQALFTQCLAIYDTSFFAMMRDTATTEDKIFFADTINYGYSVFINYFYDVNFANLEGLAMKPLNADDLIKCKMILYSCRVIGWIDFMLTNYNCGILSIASFFNFTRIKFINKHHWNEFFEKQYVECYSKVISENSKEEYSKIQLEQPAIIDKMREGVFVWNNDFMGYTSDIETEELFYKYAHLDFMQETEWDIFPQTNLFNGIEYSCFLETIVDFSGYAIKHSYFASILLAQNPSLLLENLFMNIIEEDSFVKLVCENGTISTKNARKIINCISLHDKNKEICSQKQVQAAFIKISKNQYLQSIMGLLYHPYNFLSCNLRDFYSKDWDKNVNGREKLFRDELYQLFDNKYMCIPNNIVIKENGKVLTDIDAAIVDKNSSDIALFQLKWQDPTSDSIKSLTSKRKNYLSTTQQWLKIVRQWLKTCSDKELADKLCVNVELVDRTRIYLFVLGRNHGNYSGECLVDKDCAWAQWYQLLAVMVDKKTIMTENKIPLIYDTIQNSSPYNKSFIEPPIIYTHRKYKFFYGGNWRGILKGKYTKLNL